MLNYFSALQAYHKNDYCDMNMNNQALSIECACACMTALLFPKYRTIQCSERLTQ